MGVCGGLEVHELGLEGVAMPPAEFARFVESQAKAAQAIADRIKAAGKK